MEEDQGTGAADQAEPATSDAPISSDAPTAAAPDSASAPGVDSAPTAEAGQFGGSTAPTDLPSADLTAPDLPAPDLSVVDVITGCPSSPSASAYAPPSDDPGAHPHRPDTP